MEGDKVTPILVRAIARLPGSTEQTASTKIAGEASISTVVSDNYGYSLPVPLVKVQPSQCNTLALILSSFGHQISMHR